MKMADNSVMILQNNCETINRNGAEAEINSVKEGDDSTADVEKIIINKAHNDTLTVSSVVSTQGDAEELYLAGENIADVIVSSNIENIEEVLLKSEDNSEDKEDEKEEETLDKNELVVANQHRTDGSNFIVKNLKRRSIKCLNKMQIMEDVKEGSNAEPSSPGHADQGSDQPETNTSENNVENGYEEVNIDNEQENVESSPNGDNKDDKNEVTEKTDKKGLPVDETYSNPSSPSTDSNKRKHDNEDFAIKRLRSEIQDNFNSRDKIINEFVEMADCNGLDQFHTFIEQLVAEVKTLNELAKEKEREWNNIIHLKKLKEELLLRVQRKRQIKILNNKSDYVELLNDFQNDNEDDHKKNGSRQSILKANLTCPQKAGTTVSNGDKVIKQTHGFIKSQFGNLEANGSLDFRQGKQRPTLDVQSIIADYRQRHPETVPRRGRRIRSSQTDSTNKMTEGVINFSSMVLGSGSQVRQTTSDVSNELGVLLNSINTNRQDLIKAPGKEITDQVTQDTISFKDMLLQFAKLSQSERNELLQNAIKPPPPYPEVTVHPVPVTTATATNSLLHGILTKGPTKQNTKTTFSPTLARLLTAPESVTNNQVTSTPNVTTNTAIHQSNMSISEILSTSKARNEITITPVDTQYETSKMRLTEEEDSEDPSTVDRLVIDEEGGCGTVSGTEAGGDDASGDDVPCCQGCRRRVAQFVCAGCGNQWYCSRECQVAAWDEHSEVCSG